MKSECYTKCLVIIISLLSVTAFNIQRETGTSEELQIGVLIDNYTIQVTNITNNSMGPLTFENIFSVSSARDLDFNHDDNSLLCADGVHKRIYSLSLSTGIITPIIDKGLEEPCAIVVDSFNKKFYFIDCQLLRIEMANFDGSNREIVVEGSLKEPKDIALDSEQGFLFVADTQVIKRFKINEGYTAADILKIEWPNGLFADTKEKQLCFVDGKTAQVMCSNYEGKDLKVIHKRDGLIHPVSISFYQKNLYVADMAKRSIMTIDRYGNRSSEIATNLEFPIYFAKYPLLRPSKDPESANWTWVVLVCGIVIAIILVAFVILKRKQLASIWTLCKPYTRANTKYNKPPSQQ